MNQKTKYITRIVLSVLVICTLTIPAFALTESDVQSQVSASGKEGVAGNLFIWFLCAVAFLKISQIYYKISVLRFDSMTPFLMGRYILSDWPKNSTAYF